MAQEYAGYGFYISDISNDGFLRFMKTYAPDDYRKMVTDILGVDKDLDALTEEEREILTEDAEAEDWLNFNTSYQFKADYVANVICAKTCAGLVYGLDTTYVVYPPLIFPEDTTEEKKKFVRNANDFEKLVTSFFPGEKITFGTVWLYTPDWMEPNYAME